MNGPSVNKSFEKRLIGRREKDYQTAFLTLGSCTLHIFHNAFKKNIAELSIDIDQFGCDLHFFFKYSFARKEDYKNMQEVTDVFSWYVLKQCSTRWCTIIKVIVRIVEQWKNLCKYFLNFFSEQKYFKKEIKYTLRYKRISECLK